MPDVERYWFPAKRYGWGWGLPTVWQGWGVLVGFLVLLGVGIVLFLPSKNVLSFILYVCVLNALLFAICYAKGEPPAWRWGDKK